MPILDIEIVQKADEKLNPYLAQEIDDAAAEVFKRGPGCTWVKVRVVDQYAENNSDEPPHPVLVSILHSQIPEEGRLREEITELTQIIAEICQRPPENVHLIYLPPGQGRVAFGGRLVSN